MLVSVGKLHTQTHTHINHKQQASAFLPFRQYCICGTVPLVLFSLLPTWVSTWHSYLFSHKALLGNRSRLCVSAPFGVISNATGTELELWLTKFVIGSRHSEEWSLSRQASPTWLKCQPLCSSGSARCDANNVPLSPNGPLLSSTSARRDQAEWDGGGGWGDQPTWASAWLNVNMRRWRRGRGGRERGCLCISI